MLWNKTTAKILVFPKRLFGKFTHTLSVWYDFVLQCKAILWKGDCDSRPWKLFVWLFLAPSKNSVAFKSMYIYRCQRQTTLPCILSWGQRTDGPVHASTTNPDQGQQWHSAGLHPPVRQFKAVPVSPTRVSEHKRKDCKKFLQDQFHLALYSRWGSN